MGDNRTIGVVIPYDRKTRQHISDPFFLGMLGSLADALTDRNYDMLLSRVDADRLDDMAALYDTGRARGIIVIGQWGHHDQLNDLARRHVPLVVWGAQLPRQLYCSVGSDNLSGGALATEHLLASGRRRIAFMGDKSMPEAAKRYEGYLQAHEKFGMPVDPKLYIPSSFTAEEAQEAMRGFLQASVPFDALVAASDLIAINAIGVMKREGMAVPEQVSVVGYDDIDMASHSFPPLTTVRQPIELAGGVMMDCLQSLLDGNQPDSQLLPTSLVVRESSLQTSDAQP
jgi:DNA-binding LacI/PurR family transcriptional regulator